VSSTNCSKCDRVVPYMEHPDSKHYLVVADWTHDTAEKFAWYCSQCKKGFCGQCALPKWQALKTKEGLTGPELARKLQSDPNALFTEDPTCPVCKSRLTSEAPKAGCFIATAVFASSAAQEVLALQAFRDQYLTRYLLGRGIIAIYAMISPPIAALITDRPFLRAVFRVALIRPAAVVSMRFLRRRRAQSPDHEKPQHERATTAVAPRGASGPLT